MKKTTISLPNYKSIRVYESSAIEPSIWLEIQYNNEEQAYGLCDVQVCCELVKALNTFIEENS